MCICNLCFFVRAGFPEPLSSAGIRGSGGPDFAEILISSWAFEVEVGDRRDTAQGAQFETQTISAQQEIPP